MSINHVSEKKIYHAEYTTITEKKNKNNNKSIVCIYRNYDAGNYILERKLRFFEARVFRFKRRNTRYIEAANTS